MRRVAPTSQAFCTPTLNELRDRGLPERIWVINRGTMRELYFDFTRLSSASEAFEVPEVDGPLIAVGLLRSEIPIAGIVAPSCRVAVGTETGRFWLETDEGWSLINWSVRTLEACFERRASYHELEKQGDVDACIAGFAELLSDILEIEPRLAVKSQVPRYWHEHLEGIAENLGIAAFPFPWRVS